MEERAKKIGFSARQAWDASENSLPLDLLD
jgi:hypothetical protein